MRAKRIPFLLFTVAAFLALVFPRVAAAQCVPTSPYCCKASPEDSCRCRSDPNCFGGPDELWDCHPGSCTGEICQRISENRSTEESRVTLSYVAILKRCVNVSDFFNAALSWAVLLGGLGTLFRFGVGAWQYAMSSGDPTKLENARATLTYAVLGLLLLSIAFVILQLGSSFIPGEWEWDFWLGW